MSIATEETNAHLRRVIDLVGVLMDEARKAGNDTSRPDEALAWGQATGEAAALARDLITRLDACGLLDSDFLEMLKSIGPRPIEVLQKTYPRLLGPNVGPGSYND